MPKQKPIQLPPVSTLEETKSALLAVGRCQREMSTLSPELQRWVIAMLEHGRPCCNDEANVPE